MENQKFTKLELVAMGLTAAQIKVLVPVEFRKTPGKRGRPAGLYTQEQVDQVKAGTYVAPVVAVEEHVVPEGAVAPAEVVAVQDEEEEVVAPAVDGPVPELADADFAQAA
jgi:hypothetical protein